MERWYCKGDQWIYDFIQTTWWKGEYPSYLSGYKTSYDFYIKVEDFRWKTRYIAVGHATVAPPTLTYKIFVSQDSTRITLKPDTLNGLKIKTCDIQNVYLTAHCLEKIWTTLGSGFGTDLAGKNFLFVRALYVLKYAGASFRNHLAECMIYIGYFFCLADPDLRFK